MNIFAVGWNVSAETAAALRRQLDRMGRVYPQLDPSTLWFEGDGRPFSVGSIQTASRAVAPRRYCWFGEDGITLYDGSLVDSEGVLAVHDAEILARHWSDLPDRLEGQFAVLRVSHTPPGVDLLVDFLGMKPVYHVESGDGWLISNSADLIARAAGETRMDPLGLSSFLTWGWASGDRTLVQNVRVFGGGAVWSWREGSKTATSRNYYAPSTLAAIREQPLSKSRIAEMSTRIRRLVDQLATQTDTITCGLTAGRDSRLLAALLRESKAPIRFITYADPDSTEGKLASQVANRLHLNYEIDPPPEGGVVAEWDDIASAFVQQNDGMASLSQVGVMLNRERQVDELGVFLAGHGGEIGRGFYLEPFLLIRRPRPSAITRFLVDKLVDLHGGLMTDETARVARSYIAEFVSQMVDQGFQPREVPDVFYALDRVRRWASAVGMRPSLPVVEVFEPFCSRAFVEMAFSASLADRYREALHLRSISQLAPELGDLNFDKSARALDRFVKDLLRWVARNDPFRIIERRRLRGAPGAGWVEALLPRIREVCLDQPRSEIWDFVDRGVFEQITAATGDRANLILHAPGLLQAATVFYYAESLAGASEPIS